MPTTTINISISCSLGQLVSRISSFLGTNLSQNNFSRKDCAGGVFIYSLNSSGWVISAFNHPSKSHTAFANGGIGGGGTYSVNAGRGIWAVAASKTGLSGIKAYYNTN